MKLLSRSQLLITVVVVAFAFIAFVEGSKEQQQPPRKQQQQRAAAESREGRNDDRGGKDTLLVSEGIGLVGPEDIGDGDLDTFYDEDEEGEESDMSDPNSDSDKTSWPDLVGKPSSEAKKTIETDNPKLRVFVVPEDAMVTMDYRTDRVRIFEDDNHNVARTPSIG